MATQSEEKSGYLTFEGEEKTDVSFIHIDQMCFAQDGSDSPGPWVHGRLA